MGKDRGWSSVILEGDNLLVVNSLCDGSSEEFLGLVFIEMILFCLFEISCFFSCSFVKRSGNFLAHELVQLDLGISPTLEGNVIRASLANISFGFLSKRKKKGNYLMTVNNIVSFDQ